MRIAYDNGRRRFACRQLTRLDETTGHQTQILATRDDPDPAALAYAMFSRWRQENFFRYMRTHFGLDALDTYATTPDNPARTVHASWEPGPVTGVVCADREPVCA